MHEALGNPGRPQPSQEILDESDILDGVDEHSALLYGHRRNADSFGSRPSIEETHKLAPHQNATVLQVSSVVLATMVWAWEHPDAGIVEADELDYARCLEIQRPYWDGGGPLHRMDAADRPITTVLRRH